MQRLLEVNWLLLYAVESCLFPTNQKVREPLNNT